MERPKRRWADGVSSDDFWASRTGELLCFSLEMVDKANTWDCSKGVGVQIIDYKMFVDILILCPDEAIKCLKKCLYIRQIFRNSLTGFVPVFCVFKLSYDHRNSKFGVFHIRKKTRIRFSKVDTQNMCNWLVRYL